MTLVTGGLAIIGVIALLWLIAIAIDLAEAINEQEIS